MTFRVTGTFKGIERLLLPLEFLGGIVGNEGQQVSGVPTFDIGDQAVLFVSGARAFLGIIMLAGIVVNNAIVLVDYINKLRERGMEKMEAIIEAGKIRLRPIMMTTATTVLGLLPMALGLGDGAEIRTPMAVTVIIGLLTSTILTLVIIPTVYSVVDRKK